MADRLIPNDDIAAQSLFALASKKDGGAFDRLIELYREALRVLAAREIEKALNGLVGVSTIVQETLMHAAKDKDWFECRTLQQFEKWLSTILRHFVRDKEKYFARQRRKANIQSITDLGSKDFWARAKSLAYHMYVDSIDADDEQAKRWQLTQEALGRIPKHYEAVIRAHFERTESLAEIAESIHLTKDATRMLISRAVEALKREIAANEE